jgi:hypothetical protein
VGIAKGWAQESLRIFLMDLGLDDPSLHKALGLLNQEGVSDAFLYGASVQRIAQAALDGAIFFAPAGTATTDPEQILGHSRWNDLAGGFSEADATLLLFLPTDIAGADKILAWATDILFLAGEGESPEEHLGPASVKVVGSLGPMGSPPEKAGESEVDGEAPEMLVSGLEESDLVPADSPPSVVEEGALEIDGGLSIAAGFAEGVEGEEDEPQGLEDEFILEGYDEGLIPGGTGSDDSTAPGPLVPDFGAEFVEMPPLEHETEGFKEDGGPERGDTSGTTEQLRDDGDLVLETEFSPGHLADSGLEKAGPAGADGDVVEGGPREEKQKAPFRKDRPKPASRRKPPPRKTLPPPKIAVGVVVLGILVAAVGTAAGAFDVPGLTWLQDLFGEVPLPELEVSRPQANEPVLRFSLELETYGAEELGVAIEMRNTLRGRLPGLLFNLSPTETDGVVSYALFAGPAADVVEAENLRGPLGEVFSREDPESWPIRLTPRGFLLGETETLAEAQEFLTSAEDDGALGYIVHVTYPDGTEAHQILSGAFDGPQAARWWQLNLRGNGFRDLPFLERRGRSPE